MDERQPLVTPDLRGLRPLLNVIILNAGFMGIFAAFNATQNLESSIISGNLGYWTVAAIYAPFCFGALFLSAPAVSLLKPKLAMIIGGLTYASLMAANIYPRYYTLLPVAALLGLGASILWAGQGVYLTACAGVYALNKGKDLKSALGFFNGLFFGMYQSAVVVGNLIAALVLSKFSTNSVTFLFYIFLGIALAGVASLCFLRSDMPSAKKEDQIHMSFGRRTLETFLVMKDTRNLLFIPLMFYTGIEQGFYSGDFNRVCISETIGASQVGYVSCVFAATDAVASLAFGRFADSIGKKFVIFSGFVAHLIFYVFLEAFLYGGHGLTYFSNEPWVLYLLAGVFGIGDAAWNTITGILVGYFFGDKTEAGFSNLKLFSSLGYVVTFAWGPRDFYYKLHFSFGVLVLAVLSMAILDRFVANLDVRETSDQTKINAKQDEQIYNGS